MKHPALLVVAVVLAGCQRTPDAPHPSAKVSLQEIMQSQVDAPADAIWGATATISDASGTVTRAPKTDEDWKALRNAAVTLLEAPNLLVMEGRPLLKAGAKVESEEEGWVSNGAQIQAALDKNRPVFNERAWRLQGAAQAVLTAVDKRDVDQLELASSKLLETCHACHGQFWFAPAKP
ncbi:cytochrome c [Caulobacter sp.]|uniref:cytochrome c n=1 Tax=Caulobacter sp. TaxID=78 RepID=UPI0016080948